MSKKILLPALVAAMFAASMPAMAQDRYHNDTNRSWSQRDDNRYQRDDNRYQRDDSRWQGERRDDGRLNSEHPDDGRWNSDRRDDGRWNRDRRDERARGGWGRTEDFHSGYDGYGPDHNLRRGERLPGRYRTHQYVVDNWRAHHLSRPPRGHQWVQVGADYVLVAAATGLIVSAVMGH